MKYDDETIMPFGVHKGKKLKDVPDDYLLFLYQSTNIYGELKDYIKDNLEAIKENIKNK
jgi:uncharacterized protein (DUF3820 family)